VSDSLAPAPLWFRAARSVIRRLPAGRFRAIDLLARSRPLPPFADRLDAGAGSLLYRCDLRHMIAREICLTGRYAPAEGALVRDALAPGGTFVDVGANIGYFALLAAARVGERGRVVALEPDPRMAAAVRENVALNGLRQVHVVPVAAAEAEGEAVLAGFAEEEGNWGVSALSGGAPADGRPSFTVRCAPLDRVLDEAGVGAVDLVKIDVEGAERRVLAGMRGGLRGGRYRRVLVEMHPWEFADFAAELGAMAEEMTGAGYRGWLVDETPEEARRGYYGASVRPRLRPLVPAEVRQAWPHVLWTLEGSELS
jgi:FkbM family methyltransferase